MIEEMKYEKPSYLSRIPETFRKYFDESVFKDKPYPPTLEFANEYLLFGVFKADKKKVIKFTKNKKTFEFSRENYYRIFNYDIWQKLAPEKKIITLYWFYLDICKELEIYNPKFFFLDSLPKNYGGMYEPHNHSFTFNLDDEENCRSAYDDLEVISHELKHAEFFTKEKKQYLERFNKIYYFSLPQEEEYDFSQDLEKFEYLVDYTLYHCQPTETDAYNYGLKKSYEIFKKVNTSKNGQIKNSTPYTDLKCFRAFEVERKNDTELVERVFGSQEKFKEYIDKLYLQKSFFADAEVYMKELQTFDPNIIAINTNVLVSKEVQENEYSAKILKEYKLAIKSAEMLDKEIQKDISIMFKEYKKRLANVELPSFNNDFKY